MLDGLRAANPSRVGRSRKLRREGEGVLNVSSPDVFSGQDQIDERDQGGPDTGRNEKIVGVDIVHGIEQWIGFLSHG